MTPFELFYGGKPEVKNLKLFGTIIAATFQERSMPATKLEPTGV